MRIQLRHGTAAQWAAGNPILADSEPAWATDTRVLKIGDGVTAYSSLAAAGGGGTAAPADAAALGLAAQTVPPAVCGSQFATAAGNLLLVRVYLPGTSISTLGTLVFSGGVTPNGSENAMALYTEAGVLVDKTGSLSVALQASSAWASGALSGGAQTPAAGAYWLGILTNFTTAPHLFAANAVDNIPAINGKRTSILLGGQAAIPASITPAALTLNSAAYYMTAS